MPGPYSSGGMNVELSAGVAICECGLLGLRGKYPCVMTEQVQVKDVNM